MSEPQGYTCPGCGQPAAIALSGQAWCGNDECHVMAWNPDKTLEEMAADIQQVSFPDVAGGKE